MLRIFRLLFLSRPGSVLRLFLVLTLALTGFLSVRELTRNVELRVAEEVRPYLGGDISVSTNEPSSGSLLPLVSPYLSAMPYQAVEKSDFNTTLFDRNGNTGLVRVVAYSGSTYPLYGSIVADPGPVGTGGALVTYSVQKFMSGSDIVLDGRPIPVTGYITQSTETTFTLANDANLIVLPRAYLSGSQLLGSEARVTTTLLLKLPNDSMTSSLYSQLRADAALSKYRVQSYLTNASRTTRSIEELSRYILLVLVVAAIFAAIVLLSANEALLASLSHTFGIFELLGLTRLRKACLVVALYAILSVGALVASVLLSYGIIRFVAGEIEQAKDFVFLWDPIGFLLWIAGCLLVWTLPSGLLRFLGRSPLESIRHNDRFDTKAWATAAAAFWLLGLLAASYLIFATLQKALLVTASILVSAGLLSLLFHWVFRMLFALSRGTRRRHFFFYDGVRTLVRPLMPSALIALLTTFAFSMAFLFLAVSTTFEQRLRITSNEEVSVYAANILESDKDAIHKAFPNDRLIWMLRARIVSVNGHPYGASGSTGDTGRQDREFAREIGVTINGLDSAPVVRGNAELGSAGVSADEDFAARIGIDIGDRIGFSLAGKEFELTVKNLRKSQPENFWPSFRFQINESAFAQAPKTYFLASSTDDVEAFKKKVLSITGPHVSFVDVHAILSMVKAVADKILSVIELFLGFVGVFAILAILTLFQAFEPLARTKAWLYGIFGASVGQVRASLIASSATILLLGGILAYAAWAGIFVFLLRYLTFLVFSWQAFLLATIWFLLAWLALVAWILRTVASYSASAEPDAA